MRCFPCMFTPCSWFQKKYIAAELFPILCFPLEKRHDFKLALYRQEEIKKKWCFHHCFGGSTERPPNEEFHTHNPDNTLKGHFMNRTTSRRRTNNGDILWLYTTETPYRQKRKKHTFLDKPLFLVIQQQT